MWRSAMANRALISQGLAAGVGGSRTVGNRSDDVQVRTYASDRIACERV
jgi:hypothetical protein